MKLKEFQIEHLIRGFSCELHIVCATKKEACELLGISMHLLNNYGLCYEPRTEECIKNKFSRYVIFKHGEMAYANQNYFRKMMKLADAESYINEYRKLYPTYNATMVKYNQENDTDI